MGQDNNGYPTNYGQSGGFNTLREYIFNYDYSSTTNPKIENVQMSWNPAE